MGKKASFPPERSSPLSLLIGWNKDSGKLGARVIDYLNSTLGGRKVSTLPLHHFFTFSGAAVEDNVIQFPECAFYLCEHYHLLIFKGDPPQREWYLFLNSIIDGAERYGTVKDLYTIGGMIGVTAHTASRNMMAVCNSPEMKKYLSHYLLQRDIDYQTPPDQRPTLSSFLLWIAQQRKIPGVNLWVSLPFYLATIGDASAQKIIMEFLTQRFTLDLAGKDFAEEAEKQNAKLAQARSDSAEIDQYITTLETKRDLLPEENEQLLKKIEEVFKDDD